jgi:methyltransferase (TIGR00027 family)
VVRPEQRSLVAGANALFRAAESKRPSHDRILEDPWASYLAEDDLMIHAIRYARFVLPPLARAIDELQTAHCVRHRSIDELLLRAIRDVGIQQVVVVGAGYDMRASRLADHLVGVRWIEADHPATFERKWQILSGVRGVRLDVERVAVDLASESLEHALERTAYDRHLPTCFIAEGLIHYLPLARVVALLGTATRVLAPSRFLFSFIRTEMYANTHAAFNHLIQLLREIPRLHFDPEKLAELCRAQGFQRFRSWQAPQQIAEFAPMAQTRPIRLSQDVAQIDHGHVS